MRPGKKGISLTVAQFSALIEALPAVERSLRKAGETVPRPDYEGYEALSGAVEMEGAGAGRGQGDKQEEEEEEDMEGRSGGKRSKKERGSKSEDNVPGDRRKKKKKQKGAARGKDEGHEIDGNEIKEMEGAGKSGSRKRNFEETSDEEE
jgi:Transcriptional Coactivator p15 (PC4)